jgi:hypothetical protein
MIRYQFLLRRVHERFGKYRKIPAGTYRIYLQGTTVREEKTGKDSEGTDIIPDYKEVLHGTSKFISPETSGLAVEVQSGGNRLILRSKSHKCLFRENRQNCGEEK